MTIEKWVLVSRTDVLPLHARRTLNWCAPDSSGPAGTAEQRGWSTAPFYAVGATTASALRAIADAHPASPHAPRDVRGAAEAGTSERLARFIVEDLLGGSDSEPDGGGPSDSNLAEVGGTGVGEDATRTGTRKGTGRGKKLLYLTGDKNRDTLPSILNEAGIALESVQVYATRGSARFETDVRAAMSALGEFSSLLTTAKSAGWY